MDSKETLRAFLLQEEARLALSLSHIRVQLNDLTIISCLAPELLERVFSICISWIYSTRRVRSCLSWTQVCRFWRQVALNSPRLWHQIPIDWNIEFARHFLSRSRQAPVSLIALSPQRNFTDSLDIHAGRIHSIETLLFPDDMSALFDSFGSETPNLRRLSLRIPPVSQYFILPRAFPSVRQLSLDAVAIQWDSCHSLTRLSLRGLAPPCSPSYIQLHHLFSSSPSLQFVDLDNVVPLRDYPSEYVSSCMPCLQEMSISGKPDVVRDILVLLSLPVIAALAIRCSPDLNLISLFPGSAREAYLDRMGVSVNTLRISQHTIKLISSTATICISCPQIAATALSSIDAVVNPMSITCLELMSALCDISSSTFQELFTELRNLERVDMGLRDIDIPVSVLSTAVCPKLHTIRFSKPNWSSFQSQSLALIVSCAQTRCEAKIPLQVVEFQAFRGVPEDILEGLRVWVHQVSFTDV
ncbi:hypothetical protein C8J56DRAFT_26731 [Mycena floridula]|nr:hypothetical protein C8J56DRAFT_26731 [Mycena floridula]